MTDMDSRHSAEPGDTFEDLSVKDELKQLADDARALAQAELAYQKSRASYAGVQIGIIAGLLTLACVFLFFVIMAVVTGSVIALGPVLSPWGAMAAVAGTLFLLALVCVLVAFARFRTMKATISDKRDD